MADIESELTCNVCLELLNEPHQYPCGHNFCLECIRKLRNRQTFDCPECRRPCPEMKDVVRNFRLKNIVEAYRQGGKGLNMRQSMHQPPGVLSGSQDHGALLVISLLLFISVYALLRLHKTEQILQDSHISPDSQPEHVDQVAASSGPLIFLLAPLQCLWLLIEGLVMCVWWPVWLVFQCVWLVCECVRLVFVSIWGLFCFICGLLIQFFNAVVYICGLASIALFAVKFLMSRREN